MTLPLSNKEWLDLELSAHAPLVRVGLADI